MPVNANILIIKNLSAALVGFAYAMSILFVSTGKIYTQAKLK